MVSSSRDLRRRSRIFARKSSKRGGFEDRLQSTVSLTIRVFHPLHPLASSALLRPFAHPAVVGEVLRDGIVRLAEFVIKSNGDGQTRARIVTSNRIILRHGDPVFVPPFPRFSLCQLSPCFSSRVPLLSRVPLSPSLTLFVSDLPSQLAELPRSRGSHRAKLAISNLGCRVVRTSPETR